jgi:hypothetical protein
MHDETARPEPPRETASVAPRSRWSRLRLPLLLFVVGAVGLALPAWDRLKQPSPHMHFVDLAESFLAGRLDTDTPKRHRGGRPQPDDPPGYQDAIDRHLTDGGKPVGPNDWSSYRILTLVGGEEIRGVFPWKDDSGSKSKHFRTLDGTEMVIDLSRDVKKGCDGKQHKRCDETVYYMSFPPFPSVAILPFVLLWHYDFNDVIFTVLLGALNLALLFLLLEALRRRGWSARPTRENVWLALLFTFGTVHYFSAVRGEVWFTALILGVTLHLGYIWCALDARRPFWAGVFLAAGLATRTPIAFAFVFFALQLLFPGGRWSGAPFVEKVKKGLLFAAPILAVGGALMWFNHARFENPFVFGHEYLLEGTRASIREHGLFSFHFLNGNLSAALVNLPRFTTSPPFAQITRHGLSLLATTPFFLYLLWPRREGWSDADRWRHKVLWIAVAFTAIPSLFYQNTGWAQFGYRFGLDWLPYFLVLLAMSRRPLTRGQKVLIGVCIAINLFGAITFGRYGAFFYD